MHKNTRLLPRQRQAVYEAWCSGRSVTDLAKEYRVSRTTIYKVNKNARLGVYHNRTSENKRYRTIAAGLKRIEKTKEYLRIKAEKRLARSVRYEKTFPGEMIHVDTKRLPLLRGEGVTDKREYLFVAIDDYSRTLFADIFPDKSSYSAAIFLEEVREAFPFAIECVYSDNGSEYKGKIGHAFVDTCTKYGYEQKFTRVRRPQTNGKAERVIRTLMEEWHSKTRSNHISRDHRRRHLYAYVNWYNQSRQHSSIESSPFERLQSFVEGVNNAC